MRCCAGSMDFLNKVSRRCDHTLVRRTSLQLTEKLSWNPGHLGFIVSLKCYRATW